MNIENIPVNVKAVNMVMPHNLLTMVHNNARQNVTKFAFAILSKSYELE